MPAHPASRYSWLRRSTASSATDPSAANGVMSGTYTPSSRRPARHGREGTASASSRARRKTSSIIGSVSLPVNVFCWLRVVAAEHDGARRRHLDAVGELGSRHRQRSTRAPRSTRADRVVRERAEHHDHPHPVEQVELALEVRQARVALVGRRLVGRRRAPHRGGDVGVAQLEAVVDRRPTSAGWRTRCGTATRRGSRPSGRR